MFGLINPLPVRELFHFCRLHAMLTRAENEVVFLDINRYFFHDCRTIIEGGFAKADWDHLRYIMELKIIRAELLRYPPCYKDLTLADLLSSFDALLEVLHKSIFLTSEEKENLSATFKGGARDLEYWFIDWQNKMKKPILEGGCDALDKIKLTRVPPRNSSIIVPIPIRRSMVFNEHRKKTSTSTSCCVWLSQCFRKPKSSFTNEGTRLLKIP